MPEEPEGQQTETVTVIEKVEILLILDTDGDQAITVDNTGTNVVTALGMCEFAKTLLLERMTRNAEE